MRVSILSLLATALTSAISGSCHEKGSVKDPLPGVTEPSNDPALLAKFIHTPGKPMSVTWKTDKRQGDNWSLDAVFKYSESDIHDLVTSGPRLNIARPYMPRKYLTWFPEPLRERYSSVQEKPPGSVEVSATILELDKFLAPEKSPLSRGRVYVFEKDGVVYVRLSTL